MRNVKIGVIGCGFISINVYLPNFIEKFDYLEVAAVADAYPELAVKAAERFGIPKACSVEELIHNPEIEIVVNLTNPAAHEELNMKALQAGKNVYCEKPVALSLQAMEEAKKVADEKGLLFGGAPDTFYGAAWQTARKMIDEGWIGKPLSAVANYVTHGHELWHPNPEFHYKADGGGPINDSGVYPLVMLVALLGPVKSVSCYAKKTFEERAIHSRPKRGQVMKVEVNTHYAASLRMKNGAIVTLTISNDVWASRLPYFEIHGTEGSLLLPQCFNYMTDKESKFPLKIVRGENVLDDLEDKPQDKIACRTFVNGASYDLAQDLIVPYRTSWDPQDNLRGLGVLDMAYAIVEGGSFRTNSDFITHCTELLLSFDIAAEQKGIYYMKTTCERPEAIPMGLPQGVFHE